MSNGDGENSYEALRLANIARNKALLESLGLDEFRIPDAPPKPSKSSKNKTKPPPSKKRKTESQLVAMVPVTKLLLKAKTPVNGASRLGRSALTSEVTAVRTR